MIRIDFEPPSFPAVLLPERTDLSRALNVMNSPLLFGCRSGLCGTCLVEVVAGGDDLSPPDEEEREALDIYAPGNAKARLPCQMRATHPLTLRKIESA